MRLRVVLFALRSLFFSLLLQTYTAHAAERLPIEAFAQLPRLQQMQLSPDGQHIAALLNLGNDTYLITREVFGTELTSILKNDNTKFTVNWFRWLNNERLAVSVRFPSNRRGAATMETRLLSIRRDGTDTINLMEPARELIVRWMPQFQDRVVDWLPDDPDHILMMADLQEPLFPDVYRVNINTGVREKIESANWRVVKWVTDQQHRVRIGVTFKGSERSVIYRDENGGDWFVAWQNSNGSGQRVTPIGFGLDPNILYVSAYHENYESVFTVDLRDPKLQLKLRLANPDSDIDASLEHSNRTGEVIGIVDRNGEGEVTYWDPDYVALHQRIAKALPKTRTRMINLSRDEKFALVYSVSDTQPPVYYFFNREKSALSPIGETYPDLPQTLMSGKQVFKYKARDGVEIQAYLTVPQGMEAKQLPTIIFPHGGPSSRDDTDFDYWTAFLANRGYAVLQMDFRGSSGHGRTFLNFGQKSWGLEMQDDITDGTQWMIDNGIADRNRLCIVGGSYGGYAALMAAVKTPDLFRCAVSFAGISDLRAFVDSGRHYMRAAAMQSQIGKSWKDRAQLKATSPRQQVGQIRIPILLAHGTNDRRVPYDQSEAMADALKDAGKNVRFITFENGDHYLSRYEHRLQFFKEMEAFLETNLGNATARAQN